jgi:hypothetical protein
MSNRTPMVHIRSFLLTTLSGHTIQFKGPNEPVMVPPDAVKEAMAAGAAPIGDVLPDNSGVTESRIEKAATEPVGEEREEMIKHAMRELLAANKPEAFDANGMPKLRAINAHLDFKVTGDERNFLWPTIKAEAA